MSGLTRLTSRGPDWAEGQPQPEQESGEAISLLISRFISRTILYDIDVCTWIILIAVIVISVDHKVDVVWVVLQPLEDLVPGGQLTPQGQVPVGGAPARPHESLRKLLSQSIIHKIFKYLVNI